jgi:chaperonin GroEL
MALLRCVLAVEKLILEGDEAIGNQILRRALEEPLRQTANNSGHTGAVALGKLRQSSEANFGFHAETEACEDPAAAGVIDPTGERHYSF